MVVNFDPPNHGVTVGAGGILGPVGHKFRHKRPVLSQVSSDHAWWNQSPVAWDVAYFTRNPLVVRTSQNLGFMKSFVVFVCKQQIPSVDKSPKVIFEGHNHKFKIEKVIPTCKEYSHITGSVFQLNCGSNKGSDANLGKQIGIIFLFSSYSISQHIDFQVEEEKYFSKYFFPLSFLSRQFQPTKIKVSILRPSRVEKLQIYLDEFHFSTKKVPFTT